MSGVQRKPDMTAPGRDAREADRATLDTPIPTEATSRTWPRRALASTTLGFLLAATLALPGLLVLPSLALAFLLFAAALFVAVAARVCWDLLAETPLQRRQRVRVVAAAISSGALGSCAMAPVALILGLHLSLVGAAASVAATAAVLVLAGATRGLELSYWSSNRRIFFIGSEAQHQDIARETAMRGDLKLVGWLASDRVGSSISTERVVNEITLRRPTVLVLAAEATRAPELVAVASKLHLAGLRVRELSRFYEEQFSKVALSELSPAWFFFDVAEIHRPRVYGTLKRVVDLVVAAVALVLTATLFPVIAALVKLSSPGPVFFRQARVGKDGAIFTLTKFRTMLNQPDAPAGWSDEHAHRITPLGRVLRKYRLDELPQLVNIVRGRLSLVGPRAEQPEIVDRLGQAMEFYSARLRVRPGLTGWAQIKHGYGGSMRGTREKLQYDFYYIKHQSLRLDLLVLAATLRTIFSGTGR